MSNLIAILTICLISGSSYAQKVEPPFNVQEVVKQVIHHQPGEKGIGENPFLIDTTLNYTPVRAQQQNPVVAFDGINYLVVWDDLRDYMGIYDIYGTRVTSSGVVLDPSGILISAGIRGEITPAVAFDGTNYLVVWLDLRNNNYDIYGARISTSGLVLDPSGIGISTGFGGQTYPSIAFGNNNYLIVWCDDRRGSNDIYGARVTKYGTVLDPYGIAISTATNSQSYPSVAFDGTNFLVVWMDYRNNNYDIYGARVSQSGSVLDPYGIAIATVTKDQRFPSVAFGGANYLIAWEDYRSNTSYDIYGARVRANTGQVMDPSGLLISTAVKDQKEPAVSFDGTNYLVVWEDCRDTSTVWWDIYGARVNQSGTVLDPSGIIIATAFQSQRSPAVVFATTNYFVVWQDMRNASPWDIYGTRVTADGLVLDPGGILISTQANNQDCPAIAFDGRNYLVVWEDCRRDGDIYGTRVDEEGDILDPYGIAICTEKQCQTNPKVAFDGTNYFIVWQDWRNGYSGIYGARIDQSGTVLDPSGIAISIPLTNQEYPSIAFNGINYLVVWQDYRTGSYSIYGRRVSPEGRVLDPFDILISGSYIGYRAAVTSDGMNYLVVWRDSRNTPSMDIYGTRINPDGRILDPDGVPISISSGDQTNPAMAFDGINYLVVWQDNRNNPWPWPGIFDIYCARVDTTGQVLDPLGIPVTLAVNNQKNPQVAFDGINYVAVWEDWRNSIYVSDIYGAEIDVSARVIREFSIPQAGNQVSPNLSGGSHSGLSFIVYSSFTYYIGIHPANTYRIWGWQKYYIIPYLSVASSISPQKSAYLSASPSLSKNSFRITYTLAQPGKVELLVYDATGKAVKKLTDKMVTAGNHTFTWREKELPAGIYFIRLRLQDTILTEKVTIVR